MINAAARHDPEDLTRWGRAAALLYIRHGNPLSQAVYEIVKDKELTAEHVKRILEVANVTAYLAEYDRMSGSSRVVSFPGGPATFKKVLKLLGESSGEGAMHVKDYEDVPLDYRVARSAGDHHDLEKAAAQNVVLNSLDDIPVGAASADTLPTLYFKLGRAIDQTEGELLKLSSMRDELRQRISGMFKEAVNSGYSLGDIRRVANAFTDPALDNILSKVANEMTHQFPTQEHVDSSLKKVAHHREVNEAHPMRGTCEAFRMVRSDYRTKTAALSILKNQRSKVLAAMKRV